MTPLLRNERAERGLAWLAVAMTLLAATGLLGLDETVAAWVAPPPGETIWSGGTAVLDAGLFVALVMLFPRWTLLLAIAPLFIGAARVSSDLHYVSDVAASFSAAALLAIGWARFLDRRAAGRAVGKD